MKKKIDIAEILKDCPRGMELDSPMFEGLEFDSIVNNAYFSIRCRIKHPDGGYNYNFTKYGCLTDAHFSKCVIFPKGKTTWEGFQRPFKSGDILYVDTNGDDEGDDCFKYTFILKVIDGRKTIAHCYITADGYFKPREVYLTDDKYPIRFATEEEKQKLFDAIKANGYKWNSDAKTLEKLIIPKFKVGDRIKYKGDDAIGRIEKIDDNVYHVDYSFDDGVVYVGLKSQDDYELVPNKFDINTLKPFESRVLVRDKNTDEWRGHFFSHYDCNSDRPYVCIGVEGINEYKRCIPYKENEHLLGTTNNCDEFYRVWEE